MNTNKFDVIVIGGGAAGLFCASRTAEYGKSVMLLEHTDKVGAKILISGGGRCNFTNINTKPEHFISSNPHYVRSALSRFTPKDFIDLVERYGIQYYEKKLGQLFCTESARHIVAMLVAECNRTNCIVRTGCSISAISKSDDFTVETSDGTFKADNLVIATGGLSIPKLGATGFGYRIAKQFGLSLVEPKPALVPLLFCPSEHELTALAGVSLAVQVSVMPTISPKKSASFTENILFTHKGLSGPAILQISSYWNPEQPIMFNLDSTSLIKQQILKAREKPITPISLLTHHFPQRFAEYWCNQFNWQGKLNQTKTIELDKQLNALANWNLRFCGTEGFLKAEVTAGGIDTALLSSKTMEANNVRGLYFIGEVVDVTGWLGGYNFQWAWASANSAANSLRL